VVQNNNYYTLIKNILEDELNGLNKAYHDVIVEQQILHNLPYAFNKPKRGHF